MGLCLQDTAQAYFPAHPPFAFLGAQEGYWDEGPGSGIYCLMVWDLTLQANGNSSPQQKYNNHTPMDLQCQAISAYGCLEQEYSLILVLLRTKPIAPTQR